jgi:hypothetical protein
VKLLTDATSKLSARDVQDAARALVETGDLDALILYFGHHGLVEARVLLSPSRRSVIERRYIQ